MREELEKKFHLNKKNMNREILFRGKLSHSGEWVFGSLLKIDSKYHIVTESDMYEDGHHICQESDTPTWVDPDTVGQFTGMTDKNGVKIFEGDVLDVIVFDCFDNDKQHKVVVEWAGTEFMGVDVTDDDYAWNLYWLCNQDEEIEVIGNIHAK